MEEKRIDYNTIMAQRTMDGKIEALENEIDRCGYVCLTDAITHMNFGGALMFEILGKQEQEGLRLGNVRKFRIHAIKDEWGNEYRPGDTITRRIQKPLRDKAGRKLRSNFINDLKRRGVFEKQYIEQRPFVVDKDNCIECTFDDAGWFLTEFGKHFESGEPLCGKRELSSGPCKAPDGTEKHIWYWRFEEQPPWVVPKKTKKDSQNE